MTTAEALEAITDTAGFETFAMTALRFLDLDFKLVIHLGVNAEGKTIAGPLDGIASVPGWDPPKYAIAAITTQASLSAKWLAQRDLPFNAITADAGDLVKAAKVANEIRGSVPTAQFRVALVTNREVSAELHASVDAYAKARHLDCSIISRSVLVSFLDAHADGNYQRERLLNIRQTRLSRDLLHDIGITSFNRFEVENFAKTVPWISERYEESVGEALRSSPVTFLVGDSGRGKSRLCLRIGRSILTAGSLALWCPPECFDKTLSLEEAVLAALRAVRSDLDDRAGAAALEFARSEQLALIVDSVNRLHDAHEFSRRVARRTLAHVIDVSTSSRKHVSRIGLLIPLWSVNADFLQNWEANDVTVVTMGSMSHDVATEIVAAVRASSSSPVGGVSAETVAQSLCDEPFLIALWTRLRERNEQEPQTTAILKQYVDQCCEAARVDDLLAPDIRRGLVVLGARMLESRQLQPAYDDSMDALGDDERRAVRSLLRDENLCKIATNGPTVSIVFRHDRLRDFVLAKSIIAQPSADPAILADPLFADVIAIVAEHPETEERDIARLVHANPLGVAIALGDSNTLDPKRRHVTEALFVEWWTTGTRSGSGWAAAARAAAVDWWTSHATRVAKRLCDQYGTARFLIGARLGDVEEATRLCATISVRSLAPFRDDAIRCGAALHDGRMREQLGTLLTRPFANDNIRAGALGLASLLGGRALTGPAIDCWRHADDRTNIFAEAVFAVLQTSDDPIVEMEPLLDHLETIDTNRPNETDASPRYWATNEIPWLVSRKPNPRLIDWLRHVDASRPNLRLDVLQIALTLFTPEAVPLVVHAFARIEAEHGAESAAMQRMFSDHHWRHAAIEGATILALKRIWTDDQQSPSNRRQALAIYQGFASTEDLSDLAAAHATGIFGDSALRARLELGDLAAADDLVARLTSGARIEVWLEYCARLWSNSTVRSTFHSMLDKRAGELRLYESGTRILDAKDNIDYHLTQTLNKLEPEVVDQLLLPPWETLSRYAIYLRCALAANTPELSRRCAAVIAAAENPAAAFQFVARRSTHRPDDTRFATPDTLAPYLQYFDQRELGVLADWANRQSMHAWRQAHIDALLDDETRRSCAPSPEDLLAIFQEHYTQSFHRIEFWFRRLEETGYTTRVGLDILRSWFLDEPSDAAFKAFNEAVMQYGDRTDVAWLKEHAGDDDRAELVAYTQFFVYRRTAK